MRILAVIETDLIEKGPHQTHHLFERLSVRGHDVRIIDFPITWKRKKQTSLFLRKIVLKNFCKAIENSKITLIRPMIICLPIFDYLSALISHGIEIFRQIKVFKPDVVIGFSILNTYIAMRCANLHNIPFVYYLIDAQHTQIPEAFLRPLGRAIESKIVRNADKILVINDELGNYAMKLGGDEKRIHVIRAGIDACKFNPNVKGEAIRKKYGIGKDEIVLFFMGWFYSFSGLKEVAHSLREFNGKLSFRLMIMGKGDLYEELLTLKNNDLAERLILIDWQPYSKIQEYIAASDICLLPAYNNEVMRYIVPIKMYEYMACGKPVIATKLPGIVKEFGEGNGVVYAEKPEAVLNKAAELANDRRKMAELGIRSSNYVQRYSWEKITSHFENILKDLVETKRANQVKS